MKLQSGTGGAGGSSAGPLVKKKKKKKHERVCDFTEWILISPIIRVSMPEAGIAKVPGSFTACTNLSGLLPILSDALASAAVARRGLAGRRQGDKEASKEESIQESKKDERKK